MKGLLAALGAVAALLVGILLYSVFGDGLSTGAPPSIEEAGDSGAAAAREKKGLSPGPAPRTAPGDRPAAPPAEEKPAPDADPGVDLDARFPVADCIDPPRPGEPGELDAASERAILGRVIEPEGAGVAAARVVATPRGNPNERVETTTAVDGTFRIVVRSADEDRDLEVTHEEYGRKTFRVRPSRRTEAGVEVPIGDLVLDRPASISGVVEIAGGAPGSGLEIVLNGPLPGARPVGELVSPGYQFALQRAKADGSFAFDRLAPGRYSVEVHPGPGSGLADVEREIELSSGEEVRDLSLVLRMAGQVEITVSDENGRPLPGLAVSIELVEPAEGAAARSPGSVTMATSAEGRAVFSNAVPGRYKARVDNQGARTTDDSASEFEIVEGGAPVRFGITVRAARSISGRVVDTNGDPAANLAVVATSTSHGDGVEQVRTALTGPTGTFVIGGLLETEYRLDVMDLAAPPESQTLATREGVAAGAANVELAVPR